MAKLGEAIEQLLHKADKDGAIALTMTTLRKKRAPSSHVGQAGQSQKEAEEEEEVPDVEGEGEERAEDDTVIEDEHDKLAEEGHQDESGSQASDGQGALDTERERGGSSDSIASVASRRITHVVSQRGSVTSIGSHVETPSSVTHKGPKQKLAASFAELAPIVHERPTPPLFDPILWLGHYLKYGTDVTAEEDEPGKEEEPQKRASVTFSSAQPPAAAADATPSPITSLHGQPSMPLDLSHVGPTEGPTIITPRSIGMRPAPDAFLEDLVKIAADAAAEEWQGPDVGKSDEEVEAVRAAFSKDIFFSSLNEDEQADLIRAMSRVDLTQGQILIREGEETTDVYLLEQGSLECYTIARVASDGGKESTTVAGEQPETHELLLALTTLSPGDTFGELACLYGIPRTCFVKCVSEAAVVWQMDAISAKRLFIGPALTSLELDPIFIDNHPLCDRRRLSPFERVNFLRSAVSSSFEKGQILLDVDVSESAVRQGVSSGADLFIVYEGECEAEVAASDDPTESGPHQPGDKIILKKGDWFGGSAFDVERDDRGIIRPLIFVASEFHEPIRFKTVKGLSVGEVYVLGWERLNAVLLDSLAELLRIHQLP